MRIGATAAAIVAASGLATVAVTRGTWSVGGSDSSCYALMAEAFARGVVQPHSALADRAPWSNAAVTFAPGGFIPSPVRSGAASPICAPGFSLLMAPFRRLFGRDGIFVLTPLASALLVWCTFIATRQLAPSPAAAAAALTAATTPIVIFQAVQPMNDITTAALWLAVFSASGTPSPRRWWLMGVFTGMAILVRPNLAPLALPTAALVLATGGVRPLVRFALAAAPALVVLTVLNTVLYGGPFRAGYGDPPTLFSTAHVADNARRYLRAAVDTLTPFPALIVVAPFVVRAGQRARAWFGVTLALATVSVYLLYRPFEEWWYLRFLLPAIAVANVLAWVTVGRLIRSSLVVTALAVALAAFGVKTASDRQAFDLERLEARFRHTGQVVRDRLPPDAVFLTVWQSGTIRFHAGRETILWDSMAPGALDAAVSWLHAQGLKPFLLLERWEEPRFRQQFQDRTAIGALDWPPRFEIDRLVRVYAPADRVRYWRGEPVPTEYIWPAEE